MYDKELCFRDGQFRILMITDIHEKPDIISAKGRAKSRDTFLFINEAIDALKPDFVVLGGDNCTDFDSSENIDGFYPIFERVTRPMRERKLPFATVLGNHEHDMDGERFLKSVISEYESCEYCCTENETTDIVNSLNYCLTVKGTDGKDKLAMWFIDSNNTIKLENGHTVYDCVHKNQIEWYEARARELCKKNGEIVPAVLFQHIPVPEIYGTLRAARLWELPLASRGHDLLKENFYMPGESCKGYLGEGPDIPFYNEGQFASWKRTGDVRAAFFGHDHMNDFDGEFDGIIMGQGKTGGFRAYTDGCRSGVRLITVNENDPTRVETRMYHFRDFGLKSTSLGPVEKRITDRQSMALHAIGRTAACVAVSVAASLAVSHLIRTYKKSK